jgi:tetratricopeptide (TPR) repeat protein
MTLRNQEGGTMSGSRSPLRIPILALCCLLVARLCAVPEVSAEENTDWRQGASEALKASLKLGSPNHVKMHEWLAAGEYDRIDSVFEDILVNFQSDVNYESVLQKAFRNMSHKNSYRRSELDRWVDETDSPLAYAIRGVYLTQLGFDLRGGRYISETSREQLQSMYDAHIQAAADLLTALNKRPDYLPAYYFLIQIAKATPVSYTAQQILHMALQQDNRTYYVRYSYIRTLLPRWGGSYLEMENFAREAAKYTDINPRIWTLQGEVAADIAFLQAINGNYQAAVDLYTEALGYGDRVGWLTERGRCHSELGHMGEASDDFVQALHYSPNDHTALSMLDRLQQ